MGKTYEVTAGLDRVSGYLRGGYLSLKLSEEELKGFNAMCKEEQETYLSEAGELVVDDWEVEDYGDIYTMNVFEVGAD